MDIQANDRSTHHQNHQSNPADLTTLRTPNEGQGAPPSESLPCKEPKADSGKKEAGSLSSIPEEPSSQDPPSESRGEGTSGSISSSKLSSLTCSAPSGSEGGSPASQDSPNSKPRSDSGQSEKQVSSEASQSNQNQEKSSVTGDEAAAKSDSSGSCSSLTHTSNEQNPNCKRTITVNEEAAVKSDSSGSCSSLTHTSNEQNPNCKRTITVNEEAAAKSDSSGSCSSLTHTSNEQNPNSRKKTTENNKNRSNSSHHLQTREKSIEAEASRKIVPDETVEKPRSASSRAQPQPSPHETSCKKSNKSRGPRFSVLRKNDSNPLGAARSRHSSRKSTCSESWEASESLLTCNSSTGSSTLSTRVSHYHIFGVQIARPLFGREESQASRSSRFSRSSSSSSIFYRWNPIAGVGGFWLACSALVVLLTIVTFLVARAAATGSTSILGVMSGTPTQFPLKTIVATRLHNRQATHALTDDAVRHKIRVFSEVCKMADAVQGVIAVDAEDTTLLKQVNKEIEASSTPMAALPMTPWGRFVPALNALIGYAAALTEMPDCILFVSAETSATRQSVQTLLDKMLEKPTMPNADGVYPRLRSSKLASDEPPRLDNNTLVAGALLPGHDYQSVAEREGTDEEKEVQQVELNGRTTPWNTLAVWNLRKLATTGFLLLSEGFLTSAEDEPSYGVEEVVTIALLQKLLGKENAVAKLVPLPGIKWEAEFSDPERQLWHQTKMESKLSRAARQMKIAKLEGVVHHY